MAKLRVYSEPDGGEYVIIVTDEGESEVAELTEGDTIEAEVPLFDDVTYFPTDRLLRQER